MKKNFLTLLVFLIVLGCGEAEANSEQNKKDGKIGLAKSNIAPDFTLNDLQDSTHTLSEYRGKVVLVDFWATWCAPCILEVPGLVKLYNEYKEKGLVILGMSLDTDQKRLRNFVAKNKVEYPVLIKARAVSALYAVRAIPTAYLIDKNGKIVEKFIGYKKGYKEKKIIELLKKENE